MEMDRGFLGVDPDGCGDGSTKSHSRMEAPELGLPMDAPSGWRVERLNPRICSKGDNTGIIIDEPLEGKALDAYVLQLSADNWGKVISTTPLSISGFDAVQKVIEYSDAGSKSLKVFIHKGDRLIEVSFVTPTEDFAEHESSIRKSIASIKIE